ncbi:glycosyltransferase involved in cell wall biosynthesis [Glaciihabitans tibetensis]|uniref:Glycosyltransferase involved in cell wall biosynthesis n=1 Tax=Glaciihabitans tibetensis TaxID=1266600 RepID=A0A2T0VJS1_9MICO|nr:glycosyltransferase family 1 protein [Glaciihabitans tibetensis]PRY70467.1 glycosyltransferase involved in cell wall biosynthesis [Glaciihabitans tibetensis]
MKILFDCRYTRLERHDGISRYTAGLVTALSELHPLTMMISDRRQLTMLPDLPWVMGPSPTGVTEPLASLMINKFTPDVVFTPMQTLGPWGRRFGLVSTVHDLIYYSNPTPPRNLSWPIRLVWRLYHLSWAPQRLLLRSADEHVAVSETTRQLMLRHRLTPHAITIVSDAVETPESVRDEPPTGRDLVYMGSFMPYKNVELLMRAMHLLPGYHLHLLSRASDADQQRLAVLAPAGSVTFHGGVTDARYQELLLSATALVTASRAEGFGLPLVESMALGTPVVVSDIPVFREIGGDAAGYFDPESPSSFASAVRALEDEAEWMSRSRRSVQQAQPYSWEHSAHALLQVLRRVVATRATEK